VKQTVNNNKEACLTGWKANLFVTFLGLLPFILLEAALWIVGFQSHAYYEDTAEHIQVFQTVGSRVEVRPERRTQFRTKPFAAVKAPGTIRIMAVGDSVTAGFKRNPDEPNVYYFEETPYSAILESLLAARYPDRTIEVINCGACGYGTYRLRDVLTEALQYDPDMITIMTGSSEFLEARHFKNWQGVRGCLASRGVLHWKTLALMRDMLRRVQMLTRPKNRARHHPDMNAVSLPWISQDLVTDSDEIGAVVDHAGRNVAAMLKACKAAGVPVILCNSPCNLRTHSFAGDVDGNSLFASCYRMAQEGLQKRDFTGVLKALEPVLPLFRDDYKYGSRIYFLAGEAYREVGDYERAYSAYVRAVDLDPAVIRTHSTFNQMLADVAEKERVPLVDIVAACRRMVDDGIPDSRLFCDNCHFLTETHECVARVLFESICRLWDEARQ